MGDSVHSTRLLDLPEYGVKHRNQEELLRKFIFSGTMLNAVVGGWGALQTTRKGPRDWRLILMWVSWGLSVAIAVGSVLKQAQDADELED